MRCGRGQGGQERETGQRARLVHRHEFRAGVERVCPTIVERIRRIRRAIGRKRERPKLRAVVVQVLKSGLDVAQRNPRRRQDAPVILRVLIDDLPLPFPTQAGEISDVRGIAAALVIQVAQDRIEIVAARIGRQIGAWKELVSDGDVESAFTGKIPAGIAKLLGFDGKTGAVSVVLGPAELVFRTLDHFVLAFGQVNRIQLVQFAPTRFHGKRITARRASIPRIQSPPAPLNRGRIRRIKPFHQLLLIRRLARGQK